MYLNREMMYINTVVFEYSRGLIMASGCWYTSRKRGQDSNTVLAFACFFFFFLLAGKGSDVLKKSELQPFIEKAY